MPHRKKLLLTGATGFLGSKLLERLLRAPASYEVTVLKRSFSDTWRIAELLPQAHSFDIDRVRVQDVFAGGGFHTILHCATDYGRRAMPRSDIIESNLLLPLRLLEAGLQQGLCTFINTDTMLDKNVSDYTLSKRQFREWLQGLATDIRGVNMVLEHFYGPGDDNSKFVASVVQALLRGVPVIELTPGLQRRDFIHVDDVVDAFMCLLDQDQHVPLGYAEYEVGTGQSVAVRDVVSLAAELCGNSATRLAFGALPCRANEPMDVHVNATRLHALGWRPRRALADGLRQTIDFERRLLP
jgi:CDP-paratose synthetase